MSELPEARDGAFLNGLPAARLTRGPYAVPAIRDHFISPRSVPNTDEQVTFPLLSFLVAVAIKYNVDQSAAAGIVILKLKSPSYAEINEITETLSDQNLDSVDNCGSVAIPWRTRTMFSTAVPLAG